MVLASFPGLGLVSSIVLASSYGLGSRDLLRFSAQSAVLESSSVALLVLGQLSSIPASLSVKVGEGRRAGGGRGGGGCPDLQYWEGFVR